MAKILIAEDNELTRYLLRTSLENNNHTIEIVQNGREAIQSLAMNPPDMILLDLMMPGIEGAEVIRTVRNTPDLNQITIIVITGLAEPENIAETALADLMLYKPVPIEELLAHIQHFL
ncbi:MAG: hypothetical protein Phog2KO_47140 [Phototrophicaceae bacterium]